MIGKCKHFTTLMGARDENGVCNAGVRYADVRKHHDEMTHTHGTKTYTKRSSLPCVAEANVGGATCEKCVFPTAEETAAEEAEMEKQLAGMMKVREAIVAHCGCKWRKGVPSKAGVIDCPICGKPRQFSRAGLNGHIHTRCSTPECVSWME